jgi:hypothetical protein
MDWKSCNINAKSDAITTVQQAYYKLPLLVRIGESLLL